MRVTNGMIRQNMMNGLNNNMSKLDTLYNQMNTLKKVQRPSDNPIVTGRSLKLRLNVLETEQYESNTKEAESWMSTSESALKNTTEILKDIRTRCVQAATDSLEKKDRDKILTDIKQLWEQLQQESNVTYAGRYVFSGFKTDQPIILNQDTKLKENMTLSGDFKVLEDIKNPDGTVTKAGTVFNKGDVIPAGTIITKGNVNLEILQQENAGKKNSSDLQEIQYEIGVGSTITVNTVGMANFMQDIGADIREMITALEDVDNGVPGAEEKLSDIFTKKQGALDERLADVSDKCSDLGSRATRLEYTRNRLGEDKTNFTELLSNTEDVDLEEVYVEFNSQYAVYQSALQATSKVIMNTLADFLK